MDINKNASSGFIPGFDSNDPALRVRRRDTVRRALHELDRDNVSSANAAVKLRGSVLAFVSGLAAVGLIIGGMLIIPGLASPKSNTAPDWLPSASTAEQDTETEQYIVTPDDDIVTEIPRVSIESGVQEDGSVYASYTAPMFAAAPTDADPDARCNVTLNFYGDGAIIINTPPTTVSELLDRTGIELDDNQRAGLPMSQYINTDTEIDVDLVSYTQLKISEAIPYGVTYEDVKTIPRGTTSTSKAGVNGTKVYTYKLELLNGEEMSRTLVSEEVTAYPTDAVVQRGVGGTVVGADGVSRSYSYYIQVTATTYTGGGITYTGRPAAEGLIAVDPRVIPLNSKVYVKGNYGDFGECIAADIGGGIKGKIIDVYLDSDNPYFANFGLRKMYAYILD